MRFHIKKFPSRGGERNHRVGRDTATDQTGCQSGSVSSGSAPGAIPFAPGLRAPSAANGLKLNGSGMGLDTAISSVTEQQAQQQCAQRQADAQWLEAAQFGIRVLLG